MSKVSMVFDIVDVVDFIHVLRTDHFFTDMDEVLGLLKPKIQSRSTCEENLSLRQPIPYVSIFDSHTRSFLAYDRGSKGDESRLFKRTSVGFGGHIETMPPNDILTKDFIDGEAAREVFEEVDLGVSEEAIKEMFSKLSIFVDADLRWSPTDDKVERVNRVHMRLSYVLMVNSSDEGYVIPVSKEPGVITNLRWLSKAEVQEGIENDIFEDWSVTQIQNIDTLIS